MVITLRVANRPRFSAPPHPCPIAGMLPESHRDLPQLCCGMEQLRMCLQCPGRNMAGHPPLRKGEHLYHWCMSRSYNLWLAVHIHPDTDCILEKSVQGVNPKNYSPTRSSFLSGLQIEWRAKVLVACTNAYVAVLMTFLSSQSHCSCTLHPSITNPSLIQGSFCITALPSEVDVRWRQIIGGQPSQGDVRLLLNHFSVVIIPVLTGHGVVL